MNAMSGKVPAKAVQQIESVAIRFTGDSGDGMQLTGTKFTEATALAGNELATLPDYPAEIRAPAGTLAGVSGFQIHFSSKSVRTPADHPDVLVAFNPAALKVSLPLLESGALIIVNGDSFSARNLTKAGYEKDPRETGELDSFQIVSVDISHLNLEAVKPYELSKSDGGRCKNWNWHRNYTSIASIRRIIMIPTASRTTAAPSSIFPKLSVKRTPI